MSQNENKFNFETFFLCYSAMLKLLFLEAVFFKNSARTTKATTIPIGYPIDGLSLNPSGATSI